MPRVPCLSRRAFEPAWPRVSLTYALPVVEACLLQKVIQDCIEIESERN